MTKRNQPAAVTQRNLRSEIDEAYAGARAAMRKLLQLASTGDSEAIDAWLRMITVGIVDLETIKHRQPAAFSRAARLKTIWPMLISFHPEDIKRAREKVVQLELGRDTAIKINPRRPWSQDTIANATVLLKFQQMNTLRTWAKSPLGHTAAQTAGEHAVLALADIDEANAKEWFEAMWMLVCEESAGRPEDDAELARLGAHKKNSYVSTRARPKDERTKKSRIRDAIKKQLRQAFLTIFKSFTAIDGGDSALSVT